MRVPGVRVVSGYVSLGEGYAKEMTYEIRHDPHNRPRQLRRDPHNGQKPKPARPTQPTHTTDKKTKTVTTHTARRTKCVTTHTATYTKRPTPSDPHSKTKQIRARTATYTQTPFASTLMTRSCSVARTPPSTFCSPSSCLRSCVHVIPSLRFCAAATAAASPSAQLRTTSR